MLKSQKRTIQVIVLFDGKASRVGENLWEISRNDLSDLEEMQWDSLLNEKSSEPKITMGVTTLKEDFSYR